MQVNKRKFWWGIVGLIIVVLAGLNLYLLWLRKAMLNFITEESQLGNKRVEIIREFRQKAR